MRICGLAPMNVPILAGMILAPPTAINIALAQWVNQSYNCMVNYANRNRSVEVNKAQLA